MENILKQLLKNKNFKDLSSKERKYVLDIMSHEEYDNVRFFLKQTEMVLDKMQQGIEPNPKTHKNLRTAFQEKYGYRAKNRFPNLEKKLAIHWSQRKLSYALAVCLFLIIMSSLIFRSSENAQISTTEMDISKIENFSEMNKYMSLDTTCLDLEPILILNME